MIKHYFIRSIPCLFVILLFAVLIAACGSATTGSTPPPTPTPIRPTPTPTPSLTIYKGNGYQIGYPKGWTVQNSSSGQPQFQDAEQNGMQVEATTSTTGHVSIIAGIQTAMALFKTGFKNYKDISIPATTTANGLTWDQRAATVDGPQAGQTAKVVTLATQDPKQADKFAILICVATDIKTYDMINKQDFQPMLQSFAFQD